MPNFRAVAVKAAQQNGVNPRIFLAQIGKESGFNPNARSSSGAVGIAQIVPHWHPGVDATDPVASLYYAAHWMGQLVKKYGNYQQALSVYNSGDPNAYKDPHFADGQTFNYVKSIMGATPAPAVSPKMPGLSTLPQSMSGLAPIPPPPANPLLSGLEGIGRQLGLPSIRWPHPATSTFNPMPLPVARGVQVPAMPLPFQKGTAANWVQLSKTADRAGVAIHPQVVDFVGQIARMYGKPLSIGTGTNHNEYVLGTHRESDHWTGWAADIPASGSALTRLGQDALIAAGANPDWARKQTGGLYNLGGKQIIFNSMEGGNHFNHLHVGIRTR